MTLASQVLMTSFPLLINMYAERYRAQDKLKAFPDNPKNLNLPLEKTYDFIIVGGGTGGCVVARRLVDHNFSVLLLEAGGNPPPLQAVTGLWWYSHDLPLTNYIYVSTPQKNMALASNGRLTVTSGKMMGGSSSHHATMSERGHPFHYNEWASLTGDFSWRYENVLKFFKKSETYMGSFSDPLKQHGKHGPMYVTTSDNWPDPARATWIKAGQQLGYQVADSNGPQKVGFSYTQHHQKFGRRVSTYIGYIKPIEGRRRRGRGRLTIERYAVVQKVLIDDDKRATGVLYKRHGIPMVARATKEVIISAGVFLSPGILIRSGIGPKDELQKAKVAPISILPVGYNFMDHAFYMLGPIYLKDNRIRWQFESNLTFSDIKTYIHKGIGGLSFPSVGEAFYASSRAINKEKLGEWPDIQIFFISHPHLPNSMGFYVELSRPYSRGRIILNVTAAQPDNDIDAASPIVNQNYFHDPTDFDVHIEGIEFCLKVLETEAFKLVGATYPKWFFPACKGTEYRSREYWLCHIRQLSGLGHHAGGTCRMGKKDDKRSVVDSRLKVIGVKGLRVIDASIMPRVTNANTGGAVILVAEKGADMIIRAHKTNK